MATRSSAARRRPTGHGRNRRRRRGDRTVIQILVPVALIVVVGLVAYFLLRPGPATVPPPVASAPACPPAAPVLVGDIEVPAGPIAGYCQTQLENAAEIILAADQFTDDIRAKQIGVMTAIGESSLNNLGYGDAAGPDSRGLFQQRSNYGSIANRMDPYTAATAFFQRMMGVVNWNTLPPTVVAHTVQINADPNYYTPYFPRAVTIVNALLIDRVPPSFAIPATPPPALRP
jgi:hypothetical protein